MVMHVSEDATTSVHSPSLSPIHRFDHCNQAILLLLAYFGGYSAPRESSCVVLSSTVHGSDLELPPPHFTPFLEQAPQRATFQGIADMDTTNSTVAMKVAGGPLQITIVPDGDFTIQLTPAAKPLAEKATNPQPKRARVVQFRCSRAVLDEHSSFIAGIFRSRPDLVRIHYTRC